MDAEKSRSSAVDGRDLCCEASGDLGLVRPCTGLAHGPLWAGWIRLETESWYLSAPAICLVDGDELVGSFRYDVRPLARLVWTLVASRLQRTIPIVRQAVALVDSPSQTDRTTSKMQVVDLVPSSRWIRSPLSGMGSVPV